MSMAVKGAQANARAAARALARGDYHRASKSFDAVIREAQQLLRSGKRQAASALTEAYDREFERAYDKAR